MARAKRDLELGDVLEFRTPNGIAYLQYTHEHSELGSLVRVLPGLYNERPDIDHLVAGPQRFQVLYPVRQAFGSSDLLEWVGQFPVPQPSNQFPSMRWASGTSGGRTTRWDVWDGVKSTRLGTELPLPEDMKLMPEAAVFNHAALVDAVSRNWTWSVALDELIASESES